MPASKIYPKDLNDLKYAKFLLENVSFALKITNAIGIPIEKGVERLPRKWSKSVNSFVRNALMVALNFAVKTLPDKNSISSHEFLHKVSVAFTGFVGGLFGLPALAVELPITTTLMLRSIAGIAKSEGEQMDQIESKLACIEVFALGGRPKQDDSAETGYFVVRAALAREVAGAAEYITENGITEEGAPVIIRLITKIASRFEINVTEKAAAELIPVVGGIGGSAINLIFMNHFQNMARGHFMVRRLERIYGQNTIKAEYEKL